MWEFWKLEITMNVFTVGAKYNTTEPLETGEGSSLASKSVAVQGVT